MKGAVKNKSIVYGRRLRGGAKAGRSGAVPRKRRRRSWTSEHGTEWLRANRVEDSGRRAPRLRLEFTEGRTYGPFDGSGGVS